MSLINSLMRQPYGDLAIEEASGLGYITVYEDVPYEFQIEESETPQQYFNRLCEHFSYPEQQAFLRLFFNLIDIDSELKYILQEREIVENPYSNPTRYSWVGAPERSSRLRPWLGDTLKALVSDLQSKLIEAEDRRIDGEEAEYEDRLAQILDAVDKPIDNRMWRIWIHGLVPGFKDLNLWVDVRGLTSAFNSMDREQRPVLWF